MREVLEYAGGNGYITNVEKRFSRKQIVDEAEGMRRELKILPKIGINEVELSMTSSDLNNIIGELDKKNVNGKEFFSIPR